MGRLRRRCCLFAGAALSLLGCAGERVLGDLPPSSCDLANTPTESGDRTLSIATFWTDNEDDALKTLVARVDERYRVLTEQMRTRVDVQRHINDAFETRELPDVFQVNGGSDVLRWVQQRASDATDVCSLDRLRDSYRWKDAYFPQTLAPLTCRGKLYGLPVGVHHLNVLFYNRELHAQLAERARGRGVELVDPSQLTSVAELLTHLASVADLGMTTASGSPLVPLSIGTLNEWPLTIIAFENVLLSLSKAAYETLWMGGLEGDDGTRTAELTKDLTEMMAVLRSLIDFSDFPARVSWQDAVRRVGNGEALMTITGDWGWAQLSPEVRAGVSTTTFPGTQGVFVYTPDSFAVPREPKEDGSAAHTFLHEVVEDKAALIAFSNAKHSIPPRSDLSPDEVDMLGSESLRSTYRQFARCNEPAVDCQLLLAVSGLGPPPGTEPCFDEVDALLTVAVAGRLPEPVPAQACNGPFPKTSAEAEARLMQLLLDVARQRFAAACRDAGLN
jgi:glucose/mannose transport system substrate-binding protein